MAVVLLHADAPFAARDRVHLRPGVPLHYQAAINTPGTVQAVEETPRLFLVDVLFDTDTDHGLLMRDIPANYLQPFVEKQKPARRGVFNLHEPRDDRGEAARLDEGAAWLTQHGYAVFRVGQSRTAAICHKCSRTSRESGGRGFVQIHCKECGGLGYSPSTNSTAGTPDTFVTHDGWGKAIMLGMEWKDGPKGKRSKEQESLEARNRIVVVWNLPTCLAAVEEFERVVLGRKAHVEIALYVAAHVDYLGKHGRGPAKAMMGAAGLEPMK